MKEGDNVTEGIMNTTYLLVQKVRIPIKIDVRRTIQYYKKNKKWARHMIDVTRSINLNFVLVKPWSQWGSYSKSSYKNPKKQASAK